MEKKITLQILILNELLEKKAIDRNLYNMAIQKLSKLEGREG